jgi:serine/threonine-protein kinase
MIGKTILHYKVLEKLGEGGMGVVYKAEDTKLKREVALKFLPTNALQGTAEKERFTREAQAAASLNHTNIAHIYAIEELDDQIFIAMEFIKGQSLLDMVTSPLLLNDAINYTNQIASGLQAAHEKGVIHRDIKSANVMVTEKGVVKIMDFGLAKLADRSMMTKEGATLGTAAYMSPEQSRGEKVDHRSDIWSLGVILYEMICGQLPFKGEYEQAVIYSIQNEEPESLTALRTAVPMALDGIIAKALAKDPDTRYQHVDEMPVDLKTIKASPSGISRVSTTTGVAAGAPPTARWRQWMLFVLIGLMVGALLDRVTVWFLMNSTPSTRGPLARFVVTLPSREQLVGVIGSEVALSPDGMHFAYVGVGVEGTQLFLRAMDQLDARPILGTEGARSPFFSPDGQWVGFFTERRLRKVSLAGGPPLTIAEASGTARGASWGSNDIIVFNPIEGSGLTRVSAAGGVPELVTTPNVMDGEVDHRFPEILPGGNAVVFTIWTGSIEDAHIGVLSLKTGEVKRLLLEGTSPRYAPTGHLLYGRADGLLLAVPFDLVRLEVIGPVAAILEDIMVEAGGDANFTISRNGSLLYFHSTLALRIVMVDRQGAAYPVSEELGSIATPRFSPDGGRIAITGISEGGHRRHLGL